MSRPSADENVFRAIADPTRRRVIDLLRKNEQPVTDLLRSLRVSGPTLSHHLAILRTTGVISLRRAGRQRVYRLHEASLRPAAAWLRAGS